VGHNVQGMSLGLYSCGASVEQLRVVVESVKLPNDIVVEAEARAVRVIKPKVQIKLKATAKRKFKLQAKGKPQLTSNTLILHRSK
jgi:hypothetical protein